MKNSAWTVAFLAILVLITPISCAKILFMLPFSSRSHKFAFDPVALELVKQGHDVTFFSGVESNKDSKNLHNVYVPEVAHAIESSGINFFDGKATDTSFIKLLFDILENLIVTTYNSSLVSDIMAAPLDAKNNPKYDLLVVDTVFNEFTLPIAQRMGIPVVYFSPGAMFPAHAWTLNIPHPYSYIPSMSTSLSAGMGFMDRLFNTAFNVAFIMFRNHYIFPGLDEIIRRYYPEARPLLELENEVSFFLTNSHFSLQHQVPSMPYFVEVGGLNLVPAKKLPKELEDFMQSSGDHGVIYFSLGSHTKGESMPIEMRNKVVEAFGKVPQKVLWKYEKDIEGLSKNVKLTKWAPQQDLLAHPKMRLFITHGGGMSTQEAAYHSCPVLGFPLSADQEGNVANVVTKGFGVSLDWKTFTPDDLVQQINKVIHDKSYKETAIKISGLLKDRPQHPVETAAYWLQYVIRHKGAPHLKSGAENLNFFQYFLLDVIGAVTLVLFVILSVSCFVLRKILGLCGINLCPFSLCSKLGLCSKTCPVQKTSSKGHKKKE